jgi:TonB family protein
MFRMSVGLLVCVSACLAQTDPKSDAATGHRQTYVQRLTDQLQQEPNNVALLLKLGSLKLDEGALADSQSYFERAAALQPDNTTALFNLGVIGWRQVFGGLRGARNQLAMDPETPGPLRDRSVRAEMNAKYARTLADSMANFEKLLALDPQNGDAMGYMNLLFRSKADLEDTSAASREDIATADGWVKKTLEATKAKYTAKAADERPEAVPLLETPRPAIRKPVDVIWVRRVEPTYPEQAQQARIQGTVKFDAVVGTDGMVKDLTVISGHPILVPAAVQAARQWICEPAKLNGVSIEVLTTIAIDFRLPN